MKKIMAIAAIFAATMMSFTSCEKDPVNGGEETNVCPDCNQNPCECEVEYSSPITIDGDFSDWDGLDASKVASCKGAADAKYPALKVLKVYADEVYVNVYFEFDDDIITDVEYVPFHVYLDSDGSTATGGFGDQWTDAAADYCLEGAVMEAGEFCSYDPGLYGWIGEVNGTGWEWTDPSILSSGSGIGNGAGAGKKYEFALLREMLLGVELADTFGIGVDIQQSWSSVGILPNTDISDANPSGLVDMLQVTVVK